MFFFWRRKQAQRKKEEMSQTQVTSTEPHQGD